ncbi:MAG: hypothetical protein PVH60_12870 [Anaerolineales bacterium]
MNLNYLLLTWVKPSDRSVNPGYQCEQGQNWNLIASQVVLFTLAAWSTLSLDNLLGLF